MFTNVFLTYEIYFYFPKLLLFGFLFNYISIACFIKNLRMILTEKLPNTYEDSFRNK